MAELSEAKQRARSMWAMGDYPSVVEQIADAGRVAVEKAALKEDEEVLDVACGTGNATIPAAKTGAELTGLDLTPELLEAGRAAAGEAGVEIEWIEGDAEQLPFEEGNFDVVLSVFGCMFAPDHRAAAEEIARVLRPGGRISICSWTPEGSVGKFFAMTASHMPPPPEGFQPPTLWGSEDHVKELFEGTGVEPEFGREFVDFTAESAEEFLAEFEKKLPPIVAAKAMLKPEGKWDALRSDLLALYTESNASEDGKYRSPGEYLVVTGKKA